MRATVDLPDASPPVNPTTHGHAVRGSPEFRG
jgi:hypothetical protein